MKQFLVNSENVIIVIANNTIEEQKDRYLIDGNNQILKHYITKNKDGQIIADDQIVLYKKDIPTNVVANKYCYSLKEGFYKNPNYKRYYSEQERIQTLEEMMIEIVLGGDE